MPIAKKNIPQDFLDQMKSNLSKEPKVEQTTFSYENVKTPQSFQRTPVNSENKTVTNVAEDSSQKKEKYADVMNIRLSKGRRNEIKAFCSNCGVSITQYIESSFEFLSDEVAAGNIIISKGGIKKAGQ